MTRYPEISGLAFYPVSFSAYTFYRAAGPRIGVRGDGLCHTVLRRGGSVIPRNDAESREHPGVMPGDIHSSQQREERTKKRRRCYRALSLGGWHRPRGLRNSLSSDSPRPYASVGWPPPGPIKAEGERCTRRFGHSALRCGIQAKKIRDMVLKIQQAGRGDKKTPPRRSGEAGVVQCARRVPRVGCYLLSMTRVAFFNPLAVASRVILPGSSVEATMAVIMPENTFMRGSWNDSSEVGSPLAPAR